MRKKLYIPGSNAPFRLSRSKIEDFMTCPCCFYRDRKLGKGKPPSFPWNLNNAVDELLKREFDHYRKIQEPHPLMQQENIDNLVPFQHENLENKTWRNNFKGISYLDKDTNFEVCGAVDDLWFNKDTNEIIVVDYKATSKKDEVNIDAPWQISYKRQMEIYQWLFKKNGFEVSATSYFVYCNGIRSRERFDKKLEFTIKIIPYKGNTDWVSNTLKLVHENLNSEISPDLNNECEWCKYRNGR